MIGECRGLALGGFQLRAFDPVHRVAPSDRVAVQQIVEQASAVQEVNAVALGSSPND